MSTPSPALAQSLQSAQALAQAGRVAEAERLYAQIVQADPAYADAWFLYGTVALQSGRPAEAIPRFEAALRLNRRAVPYLFNAALAHQAVGALDTAADFFRKTLRADPKLAQAHNSLGAVLQAQGNAKEAAFAFKKALALQPKYGRAHYNLGTVLHGQCKFADAALSFREAIKFEPTLAQAHTNLGVMLQELGDLPGAAEAYAQALVLNPQDAETLNNRGTLLRETGDFPAAAQSFAAAIETRPQFAEAHRNKALLHLMRGDYAEGWRDYAWRWQCPDLGPTRRPFTQASWDGQASNAPVLVWGEQGVGDEILYAGMMPDLAARGIDVIWEADARLVSLLQRSCPTVRVIARATPPDPLAATATYQVPAADLGQFFRALASDFPRDRLAYLKADPQRAADLRAQCGVQPGQRLVGLSWRSYNAVFGAHKSTDLADWAPLLAMPGLRFVNLQYGDTARERAGQPLIQPDIDLRDDLDGVAALTSACDLVITVSNTTAHLAGALGRPVWVLVPAGGGKLWYWGHGSAQSPWYPSATIFRQAADGSWAEPIAAMATRLAAP